METLKTHLILMRDNAAVTTFSTVPPEDILKRTRISMTGMVDACLPGVMNCNADTALALLYHMRTNPEHLETVKRMTTPRLRNIKTRPRLIPKALEDAYRIIQHITESRKEGVKAPEREEMKSSEDFDHLVETILGPVKRELNLPAGNPAMFAYPIGPTVLASAKNPAVKKRLGEIATEGPVLSGRLSGVIEELIEIDPADAEAIKPALLAGKTREHLSAMAMEGTGREMAIGIVNPKGRYLRLSGRRFELLIENANKTRVLGEFTEPPQKDDFSSTYLKTTIKTGEIFGQYEANTATIHIACIDARKGEVCDATDFILDNDAVVCTYLAAKRLRLDFQRFIALRDEAETRVVYDPFKH